MIAVWIILATGVGLFLGNPFSIVRNELHILLFIILAYYWAVIEIRSSRYLKLAVIAILGATAVAGMKALYISFFVIHTQEGTSDIWQAVTAMSEQLGGQRTILNGADTMFVLAIPIIAALALFYKQRRVYMYLLAAFLFTLFGLLISLTRTNWATVLLVVLLVMALGAWSSGKQAVRIASLIILLSMTSIFLSQYFTPGTSTYDLGELLQRRLEPNPYTGAGNLNYRIRESEALIEQAQRHAILGNGLGARFAFVEFHGSPTVSWAHNGHLWVYLKSGYLGLFLFYGAIITACWQLFSISTRRINSLINSTALGFGAALLALMIMSLLVNRISSMEGAYFIGLAFALPQIYKQIEVENDT
jgi:O-antigen ligase